MKLRLSIIIGLLVSTVPPADARGQSAPAPDGAAIYGARCARCHGEQGDPPTTPRPTDVKPFDFTRCSVASAEPDDAWVTAVREGGPAVGLSHEMPGFGSQLSSRDIRAVVDYLRYQCIDKGWPNGNLNFPRPVFTEKAFPEDEVVILPVVSHHRRAPDELQIATVIEKRFGKRNNVEIELPYASVSPEGTRASGVGDVEVAVKRVFFSDRAGRRILSGGVEVAFPTGNEARGLGEGTVRFEPFAAVGIAWPRGTLQTTVGLEVTKSGGWSDRTFEYNAYVGYDVTRSVKQWTLGIELNGENKELAVTPQIRKALVKTGALAAAFGVQVPVTERTEQSTRLVGYLLWDYREPIRR